MQTFSDAYWLGWIDYDNIPTAFELSAMTVDDEYISFDPVTKKQNRNITYLSSYNEWMRFNPICVYPTDPITCAQDPDYGRFINRLDVMGCGECGLFQIDLSILMTNGSSARRVDMGFPVNTMHDLIRILKGDDDFTVTWTNINNVSITKTFNCADMPDGFLDFVEGGIRYILTFMNYWIGSQIRDMNESLLLGQYSNPAPAIDAEIGDNRFIISPPVRGPFCGNGQYTSVINPATATWNSNYFGSLFSAYGLYVNGLNAQIPRALALKSVYIGIHGNVSILIPYTNRMEITRVYSPSDILKHLGLTIRICSQNTGDHTGYIYGYALDDGESGVGVYAPYVTKQEEFTTELITGSLEDEEFVDKLRPWQYDVEEWSENEYTPEDLPPYNPGGSGEDGDGDNIRPPAISGIGDLVGFVTMYALKPKQLSKLGEYLWSSFTSTEFWNSISVVLDNTLSVDPSAILNYVVSVRAYPVDLSVFGSSELPEIFFGRGLIGVPVDSLSGRIFQIKDCVKLLPGGSLDVPTYYNDFRDMEPCCKAVLHVPFCGSCDLNPSQIIGKHLEIYYSIDFCTGGLMALCQVSGDSLPMEYTIARLYGQIGATVQLSASNELEALQCIAGASMGVATGLMTNGMGMLAGAIGVATSLSNNRSLPHTTGKSSGFSGFYEPRVPYIELLYDQYYIPENYAHTHGFACNVKKKISDLHGFTVCENVDTTGLTCEADERVMIKKTLESGFFVD